MKRAIAALLIALAALVVVPVGGGASAEPRGRGRGRGRSWGRGHYWRPQVTPLNPLGSIFGGIVGGWLGSQMNKDEPEEDEVDEIEPWSKAWYAYCMRKYRSFDAETGTYLSYEGERRLCK